MKVLFHLFLGLYILELYLIGLFFLVRDEKGNAACVGQGTLIIVLTALTAAYHVFLKRAYGPLIRTVPVMLSSGTIGNMPQSEDVIPGTWFERFRQHVERLHGAIYNFIEEDISLLEN